MGRERKWVSWNIRGLGRAEKRKGVKEVLRKCKAELVAIQETKLDSRKRKYGESLAKALKLDFVMVHAEGAAGGLLMMWNPDVFKVIEIVKNVRFILLIAQVHACLNPIVFGNIYGPNNEGERQGFFEELA